MGSAFTPARIVPSQQTQRDAVRVARRYFGIPPGNSSDYVGALAAGIQFEHDRADRAMTRVFKRISRCQKTHINAGCCGPCLLAAVDDWRRFTRRKK